MVTVTLTVDECTALLYGYEIEDGAVPVGMGNHPFFNGRDDVDPEAILENAKRKIREALQAS